MARRGLAVGGCERVMELAVELSVLAPEEAPDYYTRELEGTVALLANSRHPAGVANHTDLEASSAVAP